MTAVGLLGGTFDPVHRGHMQLAAAVLSECAMDRIVFIPSASPPHKDSETVCDIRHRMNMLLSAVSGHEEYSVSDIEVLRPTPSYSIDTLKCLREKEGGSTHYHFIIGYDALLEIETWHCWEEIIRTTDFIVAGRPGYSQNGVEKLLIRNSFLQPAAGGKHWRHAHGGNQMQFLSHEIEDISSTDIRDRISGNREWRHLVPDSVGLYIQQTHLYT